MEVVMLKKIIACSVITIVALGGSVYGMYHFTSQKPIAQQGVEVAYSADPSLKADEPIKLGYADNRFSVTCSKISKICFLEIEYQHKNSIRQFPYVMQEWFNPDKSNRPWHTLDVIQSLPSFNGNPELKFSTNTIKNKNLVDVLKKNGWIAD